MEAKVTTNFRCQECGQIVSSQQPHDNTNCASFKAGKQARIKEVVEWIDNFKWEMTDNFGKKDTMFGITIYQWQAKLKEWIK